MLKKQILIALSGAMVLGFAACEQGDGFKKTEDGLQYKIVKDVEGDAHPQAGDILEIHVTTRVGDSVVFNSRELNNSQPLPFQLPAESAFKGDEIGGFKLLTAGDSAVFRVSLDSVKATAGPEAFAFAKEDVKHVQYEIQVVSIKTQEQVRKDAEQKSAAQNSVDDKILQDYFQQNNITPSKTESGVYYVVHKEGTGEQAVGGKEVTVDYTGRTLDGKVFDSNTDPEFKHVQPFTFVVGSGQVIPGWDEGVAQLKEGSKATLYIPSSLAYGPQGVPGGIEPNSVLMFDVEVKDVK